MADHVEVLRAMRTMFSEKRIPSPCEERDALDAAIRALSPAGGESCLVLARAMRILNRAPCDNPSGEACNACRATGLAHCSDPANCGGMKPMAHHADCLHTQADTGNVEADRLIRRLMSSDPNFDDCTDAAAYIRRVALAASPQQEPGAACPHIVQSKEGTAYCRLAESAGASGGGEKPVAWMVQKDGYYSFGPANSLHDHPGVVQAQKEGRLKLLVEWTPASPAAPRPQKRDTGIDAAVERGDLRNTFEPPAHGDVNDPSGQTLAVAGVDAMESWHSAMNDAGELFSNASDERFASRASRVLAWIKANRPATSAGTTGDDSEDAARYRWLRDQNANLDNPDAWTITRCDFTDAEGPSRYWVGSDLDAAIDDARRAREVG